MGEWDIYIIMLRPLGGLRLPATGRLLRGYGLTVRSILDLPFLMNMNRELPVFEQADRWFEIYFSGREPDFLPPLIMKTTPFRKAVWELLLTIPYGQTMTYGELAKLVAEQMGRIRMSAQAVGGAVGHNAISLIIPCHRVVGANGSLTGYAGGIAVKEKLLLLEKTPHFVSC